MASKIINGFVCLRDRHNFIDRPMPECALWMSDVLVGKLFGHAIGVAQGRIVSISRGLPPPEER